MERQTAEQRVSFRHHESCAAQGWRHGPWGREAVPGGLGEEPEAQELQPVSAGETWACL
ncbi:acylaminoacyl-peptide hydrolase [Homo sapiens]|uniref:Acylaminoacyl-peptide hydrolase n=2 Tax=Homo sapiens TaxID=9606 RepID=F8WBC4_HUMAN|nr:acylaminoacyl-peptide hydrolase [Homo sapiens]KAI4029705.1 acylaminoacyl-peptide hydrolase [Homo sapiens]